MQRNLVLAVGSLAVIAMAAGFLGYRTFDTQAAVGSMAAMSIDMNVAGNTASGLPVGHTEVLGSLQSCAQITENGIQDADETAVDTLTFDITALNIPAAYAMIGFAYQFDFPSASVLVASEDQNFLLTALAGSALFGGLSDPLPDNASPWNSTAVDGGPIPGSSESAGTGTGTGVLNRLTIETFPASASGVFPLTLSGNAHVDTASVGWLPNVTNNAQVAVNQACPSNVQGDVDCSGAPVNAVDALKILRRIANLSVTQTEPCPDIGT